MDIRICALLLLLAVVGTYGEFHTFGRQRRNVERSTGHSGEYYEPAGIVKRAADDKTTTKSNDTKDVGSTTEPSSSMPKSDSEITTTVTPTSPKTTPKTTDATTKPSTEATTKPSTDKPQLGSRSSFENKDDPPSKPSNNDNKPVPSSNEKEPSMSSRMSPDSPKNENSSPSTSSNPAGPNSASGYQPIGNNPFPGYNSIPSYSPNYAFTSTNHGPGGSASASAGSFASTGGFPSNPGFPSFDSRGAFVDNYPSYNSNGYAPGNVWPTYPRKPTNDATQDKPVTNSRSNFDTDDKPATNAGPARNPNSLPSSGPQNFPGRGFGGPYTPNFDYPAVNSVQGPNYAWTNSGPGYSGAAAGAFSGSSGTPTFASRGAFPDNNAGAGFPDNSAYVPGAVGFPDTSFTFPQLGFGQNFEDPFEAHQRMMERHFKAMQAQFDAQQRAIEKAQRLGNSGTSSSNPGVHSAMSSISIGPRGGFQAAEINPVAPGIDSRFAESLPAPTGGQYGVFASSSSSSMTGPDGKTIAHKSATTGVNDNGKISFRTLQD